MWGVLVLVWCLLLGCVVLGVGLFGLCGWLVGFWLLVVMVVSGGFSLSRYPVSARVSLSVPVLRCGFSLGCFGCVLGVLFLLVVGSVLVGLFLGGLGWVFFGVCAIVRALGCSVWDGLGLFFG
ncbi:hypothetical protein ACTHS0_11690, partial [Neisseria sp. P0013.S009]|uniref:hypothetical protein n=1 Tax=Neisseria sp. P0013.S009 TaxID=3436745 RepID=UPI003F80F085